MRFARFWRYLNFWDFIAVIMELLSLAWVVVLF